MNRSTMASVGSRGAADTETTVTTEAEIESIVGALGDEGCRAILQFTAEEYHTANEIAAACDMPLSTTYRKLEQLTDAGLLTERTHIDPDGNHATGYTQQIDSLVVDVSPDEGLEVTVSYEGSEDEESAGVLIS